MIALPIQLLFYEGRSKAAGLPTSCAAVKLANPGAADGEYFLSVAGASVRLYCAGMNTAEPKEYLTLAKTGESYNFSRYAAGGARSGTDVVTHFTKVRLDPATLIVDTNDLAFSTSTGAIEYSGGTIFDVSFATAADCVAPYSEAGTGNVNLFGTPFAVAAGAFTTQGNNAGGSAAYSDANQTVQLTGGGYCGATAPQDGELRLELKGPTFALSTSPNYSGQVVLGITYPSDAVQKKMVIPESSSNEQSYGSSFLIEGHWTVHAYYYDSYGVKSAVNSITVDSTAPDLSLSIAAPSGYAQGQTGAQYTITISNVGSASTDGSPVAATASLPSGTTATALSGAGWDCTVSSLQCSRSDVLPAGMSYPPITAVFDVAPDANTSLSFGASVTGGGEIGVNNSSAVKGVSVTKSPDLTLTKTRSDPLWQGKESAEYRLLVRNVGYAATSGEVTVKDLLPSGLTAVSMSGTGWSCDVGTLECKTADTLGIGASYPPIALVVSVPGDAPTGTVTNEATVTGGGDLYAANNLASETGTILSSNAYLSDLYVSAGSGLASFAKTKTTYEVAVSANTTALVVTPTAEDDKATIQYRIGGGTFAAVASGAPTPSLPIGTGMNEIEIKVTAENGNTSLTYAINVYRPSAVAALSNLTLSTGWSGFDGGTEYSVTVAQSVYAVAVTPTAVDASAKIQVRVNGGSYADVTSGSAGAALPLGIGANAIEVLVTAEDGVSKKLYTLSIYRAESDELIPIAFSVTPDGTAVRVAFTQAIHAGTIDAAKFGIDVSGKSATITSAVYDASDATGRSLILAVAQPVAYGQKVTLRIAEGAVGSALGNVVAAHPSIPVANFAVYDEGRVVTALRAELAELDTGEDGIHIDDVIRWLSLNEGRDVSGDGAADAADVAVLLRQLSPLIVTDASA